MWQIFPLKLIQPTLKKNYEKKHGHASVLLVISKSASDTLTFKKGKYFGNGGKSHMTIAFI